RSWDAATGRELSSWSDGVAASAHALSPDGCRLAVAAPGPDYTVRVYEAATGRPAVTAGRHDDLIHGLAFSPDGKLLVSVGRDKRARVWDAPTGRPLGEPLRHGNQVDQVVFRPDGRVFLTTCQDYTVSLWDAASGRRLGKPLVADRQVRSAA